jgi:hypothetical protein
LRVELALSQLEAAKLEAIAVYEVLLSGVQMFGDEAAMFIVSDCQTGLTVMQMTRD